MILLQAADPSRLPNDSPWPKRLVGLISAVVFFVVIGAYVGPIRSPRAEVVAVAAPPRAVVEQTVSPVASSPSPVTTPVVPTPPQGALGTSSPAVLLAAAPPGSEVVTVSSPPAGCRDALAYLDSHAAPGFALYCRPGPLWTAVGLSAGYTCVPGTQYSCPDGVAEIIIADPMCAASYQNEAANSYWDFSQAGAIKPGAVQGDRTWDPFGSCRL